MNIVIPIRLVTSRAPQAIARAQLYNLDDNRFFSLQFNPQMIEPAVSYGWSDTEWTGADKIDVQFLGVGQTEMEIVSDWVVDPAAPVVRHNLDRNLVYDDGADNKLVKIENVIGALRDWGNIRPDNGRSSLVRVIIGDDWYYNGRMTRFSFRIDERFKDGTIRRGGLRVGFKEWRSPVSFGINGPRGLARIR